MYVSIFLLTLVFVLMPIKRQTSTMDRAIGVCTKHATFD